VAHFVAGLIRVQHRDPGHQQLLHECSQLADHLARHDISTARRDSLKQQQLFAWHITAYPLPVVIPAAWFHSYWCVDKGGCSASSGEAHHITTAGEHCAAQLQHPAAQLFLPADLSLQHLHSPHAASSSLAFLPEAIHPSSMHTSNRSTYVHAMLLHSALDICVTSS
jgi:hypothetical protein